MEVAKWTLRSEATIFSRLGQFKFLSNVHRSLSRASSGLHQWMLIVAWVNRVGALEFKFLPMLSLEAAPVEVASCTLGESATFNRLGGQEVALALEFKFLFNVDLEAGSGLHQWRFYSGLQWWSFQSGN